MRWGDTLIVVAALGIVSLVMVIATLFAVRLEPSRALTETSEAVLLYAPWSNAERKLAELAALDAELVSTNASDTAWLVKLPAGTVPKNLTKGSALIAVKPSQLVIVLAGCGSVIVGEGDAEAHQ